MFHKESLMKGFIVSVAGLLLLAGCASLSPGRDSLESGRDYSHGEGRVAAYVHFYSPAHESISCNISSIQLIDSEGKIFSLSVDQNLKVGSQSRQILIEKNIPAGNYQKIGLLFSGAVFEDRSSGILEVSGDYVFLDLPFIVIPHGKTDLYLNLEITTQKKGVLNEEVLLFLPRLSRGKKATGLKSLMLYVTNTGDNTVTVLDRLNNSVVAVIPVGKKPKGIAVNPAGTYAYVADSGSNTLSVIDTMINEIDETIDLPMAIGPSDVAVSPDGKYVYTANTDSDNISLIDTALKRSIDILKGGRQPVGVEASPSGKCIYVTHRGSNDLYIYDLENRQEDPLKFPMRSEPWGIAVVAIDSVTDLLVVANSGASSLFLAKVNVMNLTSDFAITEYPALQGEYGPSQIVLDDRGRIYVSNRKDHSVSSFLVSGFPRLTNIAENRYQVGRVPAGLALDTERNYLYVVNTGEESLSIIDLRQEKVIDSIKVGREPFGVDLIKR